MAKSRDEDPRSEQRFDPAASVRDVMADRRDSDAFAEVLERHRPFLRVVAARLCGHEEIAKDLVQAAFIRALPHCGRLRPDSDVRVWLSTIVTRLYLDYNKHEKVVRRAMTELLTQYDAALESVPPEIPHAALRDAIAQLEHELRDIVECFIDGLSYKQIADRLGIPIGTVSSRMSRARKALRGLLTTMGVMK